MNIIRSCHSRLGDAFLLIIFKPTCLKKEKMHSESSSCQEDLSQPEIQNPLTRNEHFKLLLLRVSQGMTETNVSELRFAAEVQFSGSIAIDLLITMRDKGVFGPYRCAPLEDLLRDIGRFDLADMVVEYMKIFRDEERVPSTAELEASFSTTSINSHDSRKINFSHSQPPFHHLTATSPVGISLIGMHHTPHSGSRHSLHSRSMSYASSYSLASSSPSRQSLANTHSRTSSVSQNQAKYMKSHARSKSFSGSPSIQAKVNKERVLSAPASSPNINSPRHVDRVSNQTTKDSPSKIEPNEIVHDHSTDELSVTESSGVVLRKTQQSQMSDDVTPRASVVSSQTRSSTISTLTEKSSTQHEFVLKDVDEVEGPKDTPQREKSLRQMIPFLGRRSRPNSASSFTQSSSWRVYREDLIKPIWNHQDTVVLTKPGKPMELNANCGKHNPKLSLTLHPNGLFQDAEKAVTASFRIITPEKCPLLPPSAEVRVTLSVHCDGIKSVVLTHSEKLNTSIFYLFEVLTHDFLKQSKSKFYAFDIDTTCIGL